MVRRSRSEPFTQTALLTVSLGKGHEGKDPLVDEIDVDRDHGAGLFHPRDLLSQTISEERWVSPV